MDTTSPDLERTSPLFQALADETRLAVVQRLARGEQCVCDLQGAVGSYQLRLSFHLRRLEDAGVVEDRREGRWVYYTLRAEALEEMRAFLGAVEPAEAPSWSMGNGGCCRQGSTLFRPTHQLVLVERSGVRCPAN